MELSISERLKRGYLHSHAILSKFLYKSRLFGLSILESFYSLFESPINAERSPIFVLGCGHSGTTLMTALLNANPETKVLSGETYIFRYRKSTAKIKQRLAATDDGQKRIVEKTPRHIRYLDRIFRLYPNARAIIMMRDGRDVACSIGNRSGHNIIKGAARWNADNSYTQRWKDDERILTLKLSELLDSPNKRLQEVCKFLDLTWFDDLLERHAHGHFEYSGAEDKKNSPKDVSKHVRKRSEQVNEPLKEYNARWITEITPHQAYVLSYMLNENLIKFDYEENGEWTQRI